MDAEITFLLRQMVRVRAISPIQAEAIKRAFHKRDEVMLAEANKIDDEVLDEDARWGDS